jgi:hypothetical protein
MIKYNIVSKQLYAKIRQLKDEKLNMMREHENEKSEIIYKHKNTLIKTASQPDKRAKRDRKAELKKKTKPCSL